MQMNEDGAGIASSNICSIGPRMQLASFLRSLVRGTVHAQPKAPENPAIFLPIDTPRREFSERETRIFLT